MIRPFLLAALFAFSPPIHGEDTALAAGAAAPAFTPGNWLKGDPVTSFEAGKTYIVECWATWCGPCLAMIPHMNELEKKFKDRGLVVIGVNVGNDTEEKAAEFVWLKGDRERSLDLCRKAAKAANGNPGALFRVAQGLLDYGTVRDNALALQCAREAVKQDHNVLLRHMLARAEAAGGNNDAAVSILEKIVEEDDHEMYREALRALKEGGEIPSSNGPKPRG